MSDLAHQNVDARTAMGLVIGGGEVPVAPSDAEFEERIRNTPIIQETFSYDTAADATARVVLEAYERYPQLQLLPEDHEYLRGPDGEVDWGNPITINVTLYDVIRKLYPNGSEVYEKLLIDLSGFMWGWAVNAARKILGLGPLPNPAIMTIYSEPN